MMRHAPGIVGLLAGATLGALIGELLRLPGGSLIGAVVGGAAYAGAVSRVRMPRILLDIGLALLGAVTGANVSAASLASLGALLPAVAVAVLLLVGLGLGLAIAVHRWFGLDPATAIFASAPGGLSEVVVAAEEAGARTEVVVGIHVLRVFAIVLAAPLLLPIIASAAGR